MSVIFNVYNKLLRKTEDKTLLETSDVEYGSNANGEYWKYPNGLLICKSPIIWRQYATVPTGSLAYVEFTDFWTFPCSFVEDDPFVEARPLYNGITVWTYVINADKNRINNIQFLSPYANSDCKTNFQLLATGRWK